MTLNWLKLLFDYNYWAHGRMLEAMREMPPEKLTRDLGHSWGTPKATLVHMLAAERLWRERCRGNSPRALLDPDSFDGLEEIRPRVKQDEAEMRAFVEGLAEAELDLVISYTTLAGAPKEDRLGDLMFHVPNHTTHPRGGLAAPP